MSDLKTYFAAPGRAETPSAAEAGDLAVRFPWILPGRILRETLTGESDPRVALTAPWRAESSLRRAAVDASALTQLSSEEIIDRFLQEEDLRIVAGEGEPEEEVVLQPELDDDDEVVTEELAAEEPAIKFCKVNVDDEPGLAAQFGVSSIPTLIFSKNGALTGRTAGFRPKAELLELIDGIKD